MTSSDWVLRAIRRENASTPERGVERRHGDRVGTPDARRETGDRAPQQVHVRVAAAVHRRRRDRVHAGGRRGVIGPAHLQHPGPQAAGGAQLRDVRNCSAVAASRTPAGGRRRRRRGGQRSAHADRRRRPDDVPELMGGRPARGVHRQAVDDHGAHTAGSPAATRRASGTADPTSRADPVRARTPHGVEAQRAEQRGRSDTGRIPAPGTPAPRSPPRPGARRRPGPPGRGRGARREEGLRQVGDRGPGRTKGGRARSTWHRSPRWARNGLARIGVGVPGPHVPPVGDRPAGPRAANGRPHHGHPRSRRLGGVVGGVERADRDAGPGWTRSGPPTPAPAGALSAIRRARRRTWSTAATQAAWSGGGPSTSARCSGSSGALRSRVPLSTFAVFMRLHPCRPIDRRRRARRWSAATPPVARWAESMQRAGSPVQVEIRATAPTPSGPDADTREAGLVPRSRTWHKPGLHGRAARSGEQDGVAVHADRLLRQRGLCRVRPSPRRPRSRTCCRGTDRR